MALTSLQLQRIMIYARASRVDELLPHFNAALPEARIDSPLRAAMWCAQLGHETASLRYLEELAGGVAYDPVVNPKLAARLGNTQSGDGARYKGRGAIQLTGRANYAHASAALGLPLEELPELAALPENAFRIAAWFWTTHGLNLFADKGELEKCTRVINGGLNGLLERHKYYDRACEVLGVLNLYST